MKQPLYIGVTGFMTPQEVRAGLRAFDGMRGRKLMVGVLVSSKTLNGEMNKWPGRYPKMDRIGEIFQSHPSALNLIHFHTHEPETLCKQLLHVVEYSGLHLHGFQLNVAWPDAGELEKFHLATAGKYRLVLQVGGGAMEKVGNDPSKLADMIGGYANLRLVDDVLIDPSGGKGQLFDLTKARSFLLEIKRRNYEVNLGIAGGLGPDSMKHIQPLLDEFPDLNIDAEGRLRDAVNDDLDIINMAMYLTEAQMCLE